MIGEASAELIGYNGKIFPDIITDKFDPACFTGTPHENLSELSGRICYRSGFKGKKNRSSQEYHEHIIEVGHHSIYGHNVISFEVTEDVAQGWAFMFASEPGWYLSENKKPGFQIGIAATPVGDDLPDDVSKFFKSRMKARRQAAVGFDKDFPDLGTEGLLTLEQAAMKFPENAQLREFASKKRELSADNSVFDDIEFTCYPKKDPRCYLLTVNFRFVERLVRTERGVMESDPVLLAVYNEAMKRAPLIFRGTIQPRVKKETAAVFPVDSDPKDFLTLTERDLVGNQNWVSFLIKTSRRCAQELTRHGFESAISMESTRYVNMAENSFILHPFLPEDTIPTASVSIGEAKNWFDKRQDDYAHIQRHMQGLLEESGKEKFYSKKQASGAAASFLPMGLETNLVVSYTMREWKEILRQRVSEYADREIYELVMMMDTSLKEKMYYYNTKVQRDRAALSGTQLKDLDIKVKN